MYKVMADFQDGLTKKFHKIGDIIEVAPERVIALGNFIKLIKDKIEPKVENIIETEMIDGRENAIMPRPKNKGRKNH